MASLSQMIVNVKVHGGVRGLGEDRGAVPNPGVVGVG